jgi:hypothetical protein
MRKQSRSGRSFKFEVSSVKQNGPGSGARTSNIRLQTSRFGRAALRRRYEQDLFCQTKPIDEGVSSLKCDVSSSIPARGGDPSRGRLGHTVAHPLCETKPIPEAVPCRTSRGERGCSPDYAEQSQMWTRWAIWAEGMCRRRGRRRQCETKPIARAGARQASIGCAEQSQFARAGMDTKSFAGKELCSIRQGCETKPICPAGRMVGVGHPTESDRTAVPNKASCRSETRLRRSCRACAGGCTNKANPATKSRTATGSRKGQPPCRDKQDAPDRSRDGPNRSLVLARKRGPEADSATFVMGVKQSQTWRSWAIWAEGMCHRRGQRRQCETKPIARAGARQASIYCAETKPIRSADRQDHVGASGIARMPLS